MVDTEDIEQAATNARLDLSDEEKQELADDLADILEAFESLDEIDTDGVDPAFHPVEFADGTRPDEAGDCLTQEEALSNTENTEDGYVKGPRAT
jgi:aspartyl-tRNA(Asn)/glutamyl-tRNA(Gln) amidotransferase subunit C